MFIIACFIYARTLTRARYKRVIIITGVASGGGAFLLLNARVCFGKQGFRRRGGNMGPYAGAFALQSAPLAAGARIWDPKRARSLCKTPL